MYSTWELKNNLSPLFDFNAVHHYYPLLESFLISDFIVTHVSFKSGDAFEVYQLKLLPFSVNGSIMTLDLPSSTVLVHQDFSLYATSHLSDLHSVIRSILTCIFALLHFSCFCLSQVMFEKFI